jgi:uncharacterized protein (DUF342 family)
MEPDRTEDQTAAPTEIAVSASRPCAAVTFDFDEDTGILRAVVGVAEDASPVTLDSLQFEVDVQGWAAFSFEPDALNALLRRVQRCEEGEYTIATRRNADVSVSATADRLQALLTTTRAYGGEPVTEARVREAVRKAGVNADLVMTRVVEQAVTGPPLTNAVIAQGVAPKAGVDSRVELLVDLEKEVSRPREDENGRVDHYSVREFLIVDAGTPLLRRHPPTKGVAGRDVLGKPISATDGKDQPLPKEMPGVTVHEDDPDLFTAEYKGHPVVISGGIRVDKTLVMEHLDLRTGNVDFDGSVLVKGDVAAGVTVRATGDVTVKGTVENAFVSAGANLLVALGFTGSDGAVQGGKREVWAEAAGDFHAGFAAGVHIRAGGDVVVKEYLNHCDTFAVGQVRIGQTGGRGLIVGGECHGCQGVLARVAGTLANVPTAVGAGLHQELEQTRQKALEERRALVDRLDQLRTMLASMTERDNDEGTQERQNLIDKVRRTIDEFERRTVEMDGELAAISAELASAEQATVVCNQRIYPGVVVGLNGESLAIRTEGSGGRFVYVEGEVRWE